MRHQRHRLRLRRQFHLYHSFRRDQLIRLDLDLLEFLEDLVRHLRHLPVNHLHHLLRQDQLIRLDLDLLEYLEGLVLHQRHRLRLRRQFHLYHSFRRDQLIRLDLDLLEFLEDLVRHLRHLHLNHLHHLLR